MTTPYPNYPQQSIPFFDDGDSITGYCVAPVVGARFLMISGRTADGLVSVKHSDGTRPCAGISAHGANAGESVGIHHADEIVTQVEAGAALTAGQPVISDADGKAIPATGGAGEHVYGSAWDDCASGALAQIDRSVR